jgi:hypothetical protein
MTVVCYSVDRPQKEYPKPKPRRNDARRKPPPPCLSGEEQMFLLERYCQRMCCRKDGNQDFQEPQIFHDVEEHAWTDFQTRPAGGELLRRFAHGDILCVTNLSDVFFSVQDVDMFFRRMARMRAEIRLVNCWPEATSIPTKAKILDTGTRDFRFFAQLVADLRKIDRGSRTETALRGWIGRRTRETIPTISIVNA